MKHTNMIQALGLEFVCSNKCSATTVNKVTFICQIIYKYVIFTEMLALLGMHQYLHLTQPDLIVQSSSLIISDSFLAAQTCTNINDDFLF